MKPDRQKQVEAIYNAALERAPDQRAAFLDEACDGDEPLREEISSLIALQGESGFSKFMEEPAYSALSATVRVGERLGSYDILSLLGQGGMGEVYRARDTKLSREVAVKVLPLAFALDPDRVHRFEREARLLASLSHPNIAAIHGIEEHQGRRFLVLELIEGETLADRLSKGAIPVAESLNLALQIAEALEAAHEKGVIHRDLKPANIKVTAEGKVKVLDFGLAKVFRSNAAVDLDPSNSPTFSLAATQQGVLLGTAAYMSPEQARGEPVDKRADVWAFGCVLYEMLTGRPAFDGITVSDLVASILKTDVDWTRLPKNLHLRIRLLLERCIEKNPRSRYHDIADARADVEKALSDSTATEVEGAERSSNLARVVGAFAVVVTVLVIWTLRPPAPPSEPASVTRFTYQLPEDQAFPPTLGQPLLALSPDGSEFAYGTSNGIYLRSLDGLNVGIVPGTEGETATQPVFSPDGQWLAYYSGVTSELKKIPRRGGTAVPLAELRQNPFGPAWSVDGSIVFVDDPDRRIMRVSSNGGTPETLVEGGDNRVLLPVVLPDGETLLFVRVVGANRELVVRSLPSGQERVLFDANSVAYVQGYLIYGEADALLARAFDPDTLRIGEPIPVLDGVFRPTRTGGAYQYAVSVSGSLVYLPGTSGTGPSTVVWVNEMGRSEAISDQLRDYRPRLRISPDRAHVAVEVAEALGGEATTHIWLMNVDTGSASQLTFEGSRNHYPVWTSDSQAIVFSSERAGKFGIYRKAANGSGPAELLLDRDAFVVTTDLLDDRVLAFSEPSENGDFDIKTLTLDGDGSVADVLVTPAMESDARFSPDGQWMAYVSDESGEDLVYIRPYPASGGGQRRISESRAFAPVWSPDGRALYYVAQLPAATLMRVPIQVAGGLRLDRPEELFPILGRFEFDGPGFFGPTFSPPFDVAPDPIEFVFLQLVEYVESGGPPRQINVVRNWIEELKERVPPLQ